MELLFKSLFRNKFQTFFIVILFYLVGVAGIVLPFTRPLFVGLIPFALLLSFALIALLHNLSESKTELLVMVLIFVLSYLIEVAGVNTKAVFGSYVYGDALGIKLFGTPLLIGINWVMVVYCSASTLELTRWPVPIQVLLASLLMVLYDVVLERVAPLLDMWSWEGDRIPGQNYLAWFVVAIGFHTLMKRKTVRTINPVAPAIFICQIIFFMVILIFVK